MRAFDRRQLKQAARIQPPFLTTQRAATHGGRSESLTVEDAKAAKKFDKRSG
jgi:hypothetical protein